MATTTTATFQVTNWEEVPFDERDGAAKLTRANVTKDYSGQITGSSVTQWLMAYASDGSATFVGIERITGSVAGADGTLVVQHVGTFESGAAKAELSVVAGAGSGELAAATGQGTFLADPNGSIELTLELG